MKEERMRFAQELIRKRTESQAGPPTVSTPQVPQVSKYKHLHKLHPQVAENLHNFLEGYKKQLGHGQQ